MPMSFLQFPLELQEKILENLNDRSLIKAYNVCSGWNEIIYRIFRRRGRENIPLDVVQELNPGSDPNKLATDDTLDWFTTYKKWLNSSPPAKSRPESASVIETSSIISSYLVTGDLVIVAHGTKVDLYNGSGKFLLTICSGEQTLCDMGVMNTTKKDLHTVNVGGVDYVSEDNLLILSGTERIVVCSLTSKPLFKVLWTYNFLAALYSSGISVCYHQFCIQENIKKLLINEVVQLSETNSDIDVTCIYEIDCPSQVWKWKLWNKKIYCVLATGQLAVWGIEKEQWLSISNRLWELLYQNPSVMYRGLYICNSRTSQSLLEYWHCLAGDSYWLISTDGVNFDRYFPIRDRAIHEDVSAVCVKRRLILTVTGTGSLYMYRYDGRDHDIGSFWSLEPSLVLDKFSDKPLMSLDVSFDGSHFVLVGKASGRQLVVGQWAKPEE